MPRIAVALLSLFVLTACSHFRSSGTKIVAPHSVPELYGALHEAERLLGRTHRGGTIAVRFEEGSQLSHARPWRGRWNSDYRGVALGQYEGRGNILLFTTAGQFRPETAIHEMAHAILDTHGIPWDQHHEIMRKAGVP